jgi:ribosomal protein L12E/L44/L45/RPP1/RPP2
MIGTIRSPFAHLLLALTVVTVPVACDKKAEEKKADDKKVEAKVEEKKAEEKAEEKQDGGW